jgi:hypothetical protein
LDDSIFEFAGLCMIERRGRSICHSLLKLIF